MAEYIDRRRLFNALADYWNIPHDWDGGIAQPCEDALAFIENAPEEDVAPVVHGEWVEESNEAYSDACEAYITWTTYLCSKCGNEIMKAFNFCPNCGAKMDGGNDNG